MVNFFCSGAVIFSPHRSARITFPCGLALWVLSASSSIFSTSASRQHRAMLHDGPQRPASVSFQFHLSTTNPPTHMHVHAHMKKGIRMYLTALSHGANSRIFNN